MHPRLVVLALALAACSSSTPTAVPSDDAAPREPAATRTAEPTRSADPRAPRPGTRDEVTAPDLSAPPGERAPAEKAALATAPGVYFYEQEGAMVFGTFRFDEPPEGSLTVFEATKAGDGARQRQLREYSDRRSQEQVLIFREDALLLEKIVSRFGSGAGAQEMSCEPERPMTVVELPLRAGSTWKSTGSCDGLKITMEGEVVREQPVRIDGDPVPATVVRFTVDARGDGFRDRSTTTMWLSVEHRLTLRSESTGEGSMQGATYTTELSERLVSLEPGS